MTYSWFLSRLISNLSKMKGNIELSREWYCFRRSGSMRTTNETIRSGAGQLLLGRKQKDWKPELGFEIAILY